MPKRIYSVPRARAARHNLVYARQLHTSLNLWEERAPVFEFLEKNLARKPVGVQATYTANRKRGRVDYVYEKGGKHYFLVERRFFPKDGGTPRVERVALPKNLRAGKHFSDSLVREAMAGARMGAFKGTSLNERVLSESQRGMLRKAGWRRIQATKSIAYWLSPK